MKAIRQVLASVAAIAMGALALPQREKPGRWSDQVDEDGDEIIDPRGGGSWAQPLERPRVEPAHEARLARAEEKRARKRAARLRRGGAA